jgi:hypothetical protein
MDLLQVSRSQLISEVYACKKMLYRLINLPKDTIGFFNFIITLFVNDM